MSKHCCDYLCLCKVCGGEDDSDDCDQVCLSCQADRMANEIDYWRDADYEDIKRMLDFIGKKHKTRL